MSVPIVSIICPALNMLSLTIETLKGIALTCDVSFEVICVNNGSTDGTKEWLDTFAEPLLKQNPNFVKFTAIHNKNNQFLSRALNQGVLHSSGKYISVVMNDIICPPKMFSFFINMLENDKEHKYGAVGPYPVEDERLITCDSFYANYDKIPKVDEWTNQWHFSCCYIIRREDWDNVGGWQENFKTCEMDLDLGFRLEIYGLFQTSYKGMVCSHIKGSWGRSQIKNESTWAKLDNRRLRRKWGFQEGGKRDPAHASQKAIERAKGGNFLPKSQLEFRNKIKIVDVENIGRRIN